MLLLRGRGVKDVVVEATRSVNEPRSTLLLTRNENRNTVGGQSTKEKFQFPFSYYGERGEFEIWIPSIAELRSCVSSNLDTKMIPPTEKQPD